MTPDVESLSDIPVRLPKRIGDTLGPWVVRTPHRPAIVERGGAWTYAELAKAVAAMRQWLTARGVRSGDRVMVVGENCRIVVAALLGIADLGAWPVMVNARLSAREIDDIRAHCTPRRVIYATDISAHARAHAERHGGGMEDVPSLGTVCIGPCDLSTIPEVTEAEEGDQIGALIYTSGSTGRPKGVMLTHRNLLFIAAAASSIRSVTPDDRLYAVMPITHSVGLSSVLLCALLSGASVYLSHRFNPADVLTTLRAAGVTIMLGTPMLFSLLADYARTKGIKAIDSPTLRIISASGSPLDMATKSVTERLFGLALDHGYGLTECSPTISQTRPGRPVDDLSVGQLLPGVEARLVLNDGTVAQHDGTGELFIRGPNIMKGYYMAADETAGLLDDDGWFRTGDLVRIENGNLFIVGRKKDLIIRFGFNISPAEIESVLNAHPAVMQSAVVGQNLGSNEEIVAFVQFAPGAADSLEELQTHVSARLVSYKRPSHIHVVKTMPTTTSGKIDKRALVAVLSGTDVRVS